MERLLLCLKYELFLHSRNHYVQHSVDCERAEFHLSHHYYRNYLIITEVTLLIENIENYGGGI